MLVDMYNNNIITTYNLKCISLHGFYSIMHDSCYTYMHALHYSYGWMQCINKNDVIIPVILGPNIPNPYRFTAFKYPSTRREHARASIVPVTPYEYHSKTRVLHRHYVIPRNTSRGNQQRN